jgi:hypothetical protein
MSTNQKRYSLVSKEFNENRQQNPLLGQLARRPALHSKESTTSTLLRNLTTWTVLSQIEGLHSTSTGWEVTQSSEQHSPAVLGNLGPGWKLEPFQAPPRQPGPCALAARNRKTSNPSAPRSRRRRRRRPATLPRDQQPNKSERGGRARHITEPPRSRWQKRVQSPNTQ